jgi:hypothetical protein
MKIGVISDTHNFWDPKIPEIFEGVDHILHGGDIGQPGILAELERIAPVTAVGGNTDDSGLHYAPVKTVELAGRKFFIQHIVHPPALEEKLRLRLARERPDAVVFGHTHKRFCESLGGILYLNPGYAGQPRFGADRSVAIAQCDGDGIRVEYVEL